MVSKDTVKNNTTKENLRLLDNTAWRRQWDGKYFERVRGYDHFFDSAEILIEELKKRGIDVKFYEDLWNSENERIKLRSTNYQEYKKKYENY